MTFFLCEIVARLVAAYLCVDCYRRLRRGLVDRKVRFFNPDLLDWSNWVADRDAAPIRYWIQMGMHAFALVACLLVAIFGWWQPGA